MNANALKAKIILNGLTVPILCEKTGISPSCFYRKLAGKVEFTQGEISEISRALNLDKEEIFAIFFEKEVS